MADFGKYFRAYMYMQDILKNDFTYNYITEGLKDGDKGEDKLDGKTNEKVIDMEWVVAIEETLPYIQKAIDEQRRFIKQVDNVVRVELAKKIGPESVKHLSQHTNFIAKVEGDMVTPNKILTIEREESFAIYENRVLMTLIRKALHFVDDKYSKMKDTKILLTTGATERNSSKNIYDVAGNCWEWTTEANDTYYRVLRGGYYFNNGSDHPASNRNAYNPTHSYNYVSFRPLLYVAL